MKLWLLILLIEHCCFYLTTAVPLTHDNYHVSIDNGTLKNVLVSSDVSSVDLSGSDIESIGENSLDGLTNIKILNLSNNKLKNLPPLIFSKLNNLEELSLANNSISSFNKTFVGLSSLKLLNISNNSMRYLKEGHLFGLTKSTNVIVGGNDLCELSSRAFKEWLVPVIPKDGESSVGRSNTRKKREYKRSPLSVHLCITNDIVDSIEMSPSTYRLDNCKYGSMSVDLGHPGSTFTMFPLGIKGFKHGWNRMKNHSWTDVDISRKEITDITELMDGLPSSVSYINLKYNYIETIKNNGIEYKNLRVMNLESNRISKIEDGAFEKMNLTVLNIMHNHLNSTAFVATLPSSIEHLYLSYNSISEITLNSFHGLKKLIYLNLMENHIENIEPGTFKNQENLQVIDLAFNQIHELGPKVFQGLTSLHTLLIYSNKIEKISRYTFEELRGCKQLVIRLGGNIIDTIEEGTFSHMHLNYLQLGSNKLGDDSIAEGAFNGSTIRNIDLSSNSITKINGEIFNGISGDYEVIFYDNPIKSIEKGAAKFMENVTKLYLASTQLQVLGNGALFGLSTEKNVVIDLSWTPINIIQGGVFDDV